MTTKQNFLTEEARQIAKYAAVGRATLLRTLASHNTRSTVKRAAANDAPDSGFEQSFASIAYTYVRDKAPNLSDYMIGFQLLERNDDSTKAVGIFGFKIGEQWAYVPVFFLNGNLKGNDFLYLKNQDMFVPLDDSWVNELLAKKPHILGKPSKDDMRGHGAIQPNFNSLISPPNSGKYASEQPRIKPWARDIMPKVASFITKNPAKLEKFAGLDDVMNLRNFLKTDVRLVKLAIDIKNKYPLVGSGMDEFYGPALLRDVLLDMRKEALAAERVSVLKATKKAVADNIPKVEIKTDSIITENTPMEDSDRERLLRDGYLIKDRRTGDEVSVAYNVQVMLALTNPDSTDVYDVLIKPGTFKRCLVIYKPHTKHGKGLHSTVVELEGDPKAFANYHSTKIFVKQQERGKSDIEEFKDWFDALPSNKDTLAVDASYVIVSQNGNGTGVFEVREDIGDDCWRVCWRGGEGDQRPDYLPAVLDTEIKYPSTKPIDIICFNKREGSNFKSIDDVLYIPPDAKIIKVKDAPDCCKCDKCRDKCTCDYFSPDYSVSEEPIKPGNLADLQMQIMQKTAEIKIWTDHNEVVINRRRMTKLAGLFHLVKDHGLREKQAKRMLKDAERLSGARFRIKYADQYAAMEGGYSTGFPEPEYGTSPGYQNNVPAMTGPQDFSQAIGQLQAANTDPSIYDNKLVPDPMAMQTAQQAAQTGQKEVFDTTLISSMLKTVNEDSMIDKFIGPLIQAMDKLGRLLFMFYWHNEQFMDRFGKQDMPELEDSLKNGFNVLGNIVMYLRQKTIDSGTHVNLGSDLSS